MVSSPDPGEARLHVETLLGDPSGARIVIRGEVDVADVEHLEVALDRVQVDGARTVQLDVSDLTFVDSAVLRRLTTFAHRVRQTGHTVVTRGARPTLHRMARELGVQEDRAQ